MTVKLFRAHVFLFGSFIHQFSVQFRVVDKVGYSLFVSIFSVFSLVVITTNHGVM